MTRPRRHMKPECCHLRACMLPIRNCEPSPRIAVAASATSSAFCMATRSLSYLTLRAAWRSALRASAFGPAPIRPRSTPGSIPCGNSCTWCAMPLNFAVAVWKVVVRTPSTICACGLRVNSLPFRGALRGRSAAPAASSPVLRRGARRLFFLSSKRRAASRLTSARCAFSRSASSLSSAEMPNAASSLALIAANAAFAAFACSLAAACAAAAAAFCRSSSSNRRPSWITLSSGLQPRMRARYLS
mmetsp:Transcript_69946/g.191991  ORF Transcript_69946/g.191991 Transcript_69946/m.191991 type:complete len:244 (+) Transcript_69946:423-1154(+)